MYFWRVGTEEIKYLGRKHTFDKWNPVQTHFMKEVGGKYDDI